MDRNLKARLKGNSNNLWVRRQFKETVGLSIRYLEGLLRDEVVEDDTGKHITIYEGDGLVKKGVSSVFAVAVTLKFMRLIAEQAKIDFDVDVLVNMHAFVLHPLHKKEGVTPRQVEGLISFIRQTYTSISNVSTVIISSVEADINKNGSPELEYLR